MCLSMSFSLRLLIQYLLPARKVVMFWVCPFVRLSVISFSALVLDDSESYIYRGTDSGEILRRDGKWR